MADSKSLYFIPIIARAINNVDPKKAMKEAFDEINELGNRPENKKGFSQFLTFVKASFDPSGEGGNQKIEIINNAILRLIYDLATDTFEGDQNQKEDLIAAIKSNRKWNAEYERVIEEAQDFLGPEASIEIEILRNGQNIASFTINKDSDTISPIFPSKYEIRFSNGRVLWEGELTREDVIWTYAFPGENLPMAAETETHRPEPTKRISLLNGELIFCIFAGLEGGRLEFKRG